MKYVIHILLLAVIFFFLFITIFLSPYKYEWDPELMQEDEDAVVVLKLIYFFMLLFIAVGGWVSWKKNHRVIWMYAVLMMIAFWGTVKLILVK